MKEFFEPKPLPILDPAKARERRKKARYASTLREQEEGITYLYMNWHRFLTYTQPHLNEGWVHLATTDITQDLMGGYRTAMDYSYLMFDTEVVRCMGKEAYFNINTEPTGDYQRFSSLTLKYESTIPRAEIQTHHDVQRLGLKHRLYLLRTFVDEAQKALEDLPEVRIQNPTSDWMDCALNLLYWFNIHYLLGILNSTRSRHEERTQAFASLLDLLTDHHECYLQRRKGLVQQFKNKTELEARLVLSRQLEDAEQKLMLEARKEYKQVHTLVTREGAQWEWNPELTAHLPLNAWLPTSNKDLVERGKAHHNCVGSYAPANERHLIVLTAEGEAEVCWKDYVKDGRCILGMVYINQYKGYRNKPLDIPQGLKDLCTYLVGKDLALVQSKNSKIRGLGYTQLPPWTTGEVKLEEFDYVA